ncbi:type II toxin-antitoxin system death-on-curing family toxin [Catalinimonas alkaloidigena]|nr:type II toxin-antitoxin system death-on-curing family toxin [Catalinimonas alkaloidigena]
MISITEVIRIHEVLIEKFGGSKGIRDRALLESAIQRPYQTFDQKLLYPSVVEQAAALAESLINNHPFQDGNKRIGYTIMRLQLMMHGLDIEASEDEKYDFVINIASGNASFDEITKWINDHLKK